ncbi:MAG: hypothetical protein ABI759_12550 [Candidatus Solibacter sp.]
MPNADEVAPPGIYRWVLGLAGRLAPPAFRAEFASRWNTRLVNLCILVDRGEVAGREKAEMLLLCGAALSTAFWLRFSRAGLRRWVLGPQFVIALSLSALALLALLSRGFQGARAVMRAMIYWNLDPLPPWLIHKRPYSPMDDIAVGFVVPFAMALAMGAALVAIGRLSLGRYGWRYWLYLAIKILSMILLVPLLWIETSRGLWHFISPELLRVWVAGLGASAAFLLGFGVAALWVFADQRQRCPVCLRRMAQPVTSGSWASMFEPVTTEFLCDDGHGALSMAESEMGEGDRWIALDSSWRGL